MGADVKQTDIGVVAPYRDQVALLKRSLAGLVEVSTVDQFQGRDKAVIIYSCTRNDVKENKKVKNRDVADADIFTSADADADAEFCRLTSADADADADV
ncbi:unnamed protein product [Diatraea saccharalis]|uniref:DNA2/NAM7 helicase-like C-terminal domain-containing protein n=1 Tax=Diatraea saccharalis TaxID=40085 RepID=A0A9N9R7Y3_9NEOP|nr:unnamed protein product [Diatraea saccharalis]